MIIKVLIVGPIGANCYIVGCPDTLEAVVIDPGAEADRILMGLAEEKLTLKYILNTHGHFDHVAANKKMKDATGAEILIHAADAQMLGQIAASASMWGMTGEDSPPPDRTPTEGDSVQFGNITLEVLHTPGHSPGGLSFYTNGSVWVGDTLFAGSIGRTDFPGGNFETLISSIREKIFRLGDEVQVYTGHGPATTIGQEKRYNPFAGLG